MAKNKSETRQYTAPAVDRALDILEFMADHHQPFGATELARELDVPLNSVFRILKRLTDRGYTVQDQESGGYQLGTRVFTLGMSLYGRFDLRLRARKHLEWLTKESEETCQLQVPQGERLLVMDCITPETQIYLSVVPGSLVYYHPNAYGKAVLAFMDEDEVERILPRELPKLTPNTLSRRWEVLEQLDAVRKTGLAYDDEEYTIGMCCIGSPVFDVTGAAVAGLGVTYILSNVTEADRTRFERLVLECAHRVSKDIGYTGDYFDKRLKRGEKAAGTHPRRASDSVQDAS